MNGRCLVFAMLAMTASGAELSVVERDGGFAVERDGRTVVSAVRYDCGEVPAEAVRRNALTTSRGDRVWNVWCEEREHSFRLEVAARADGAVEITLAGQVPPFGSARARKLFLDLPPSSSVTNQVTRFLVADGLTFDFGPMGVGDVMGVLPDAEGWSHMDALWSGAKATRSAKGVTLALGCTVGGPWGGFAGAKVVIRPGEVAYEDLHAVRRYHYASPFFTSRYRKFGADGRGRFYTHERGEAPFAARFDKLPAGYYVATFGAGNAEGDENRFSLSVNGETLWRDVTIPKGKARAVSRVLHITDGAAEFSLTGRWIASFAALQPLLMDGEDFSFTRGPWVSDGYEMSPLIRNGPFAAPLKFATSDDTYDLPEPGTEFAGTPRETSAPNYLPDMDLPGRAWTRNARIHRILNNSSSLAEFDDPKTLAGYFDREVMPRKPNAIMLSGMLTRHTYYGQEDATLARIGRIVAEAHSRGLKVIDHFDATILWNVCGGFRVLAERLGELIRSFDPAQEGHTFNFLPAYQFCLNNPVFRERFYAYAERDVRENKVDALQLDEVVFYCHGCLCKHCRAAFERDTGWKMPMNELDPAWREGTRFYRVWQTWRQRKATNFLGELRLRLKALKPDLVFSNYSTLGGFTTTYGSFGNGSDIFDWRRNIDFFGVEIMTRHVLKDARETLVSHRLGDLIARPSGASVWNWYYNANWQNDYAAWALDEMTAQSPLLSPLDPCPGAPDYANFRGMDRSGVRSVARVALLFSIEERDWKRRRYPENYWGSAQIRDTLKLAKELEARHIPYDFIDDETLAAGDLSRYERVLVAGEKGRDDPDAIGDYGRFWTTTAPRDVLTSLARERDGSLAIHFLNAAGGASDTFPPLNEDLVFTLPEGDAAEVTSPDFAGVRTLTAERLADGRRRFTIPRDWLKTYLFVRIPATPGRLALGRAAEGFCEITDEETLPGGLMRVEYTLRPERDSVIRCRVELPAKDRWNGEFWGIGNSSLGGRVPGVRGFSDMGFAVATTDLGTARYVDGDRKGQPLSDVAFRDYAERATHLMTVQAKRFVEAYYGRKPVRCYFRGASCGGRQGLMEAAYHPEDYDGIFSLIPGISFPAESLQALNVYRQTHDESGRELVTPEQLRVLADAPIEYMRTRDVAPYAGFILSNPFMSEADIDGVLDVAAKKDRSLGEPALRARLKNVFLGAKDERGRVTCHGMLPGTFWGNARGMNYRTKTLCGQCFIRQELSGYPSWREFDEAAMMRGRGAEVNATSLDLSAFAKRGGKLIVAVGWEDQTTPAPETIAWYERMAASNGGMEATQRFCRLFPLPGIAHGGGKGRIGVGEGVAGPVHYEMMRKWVTEGVAPETFPLDWPARQLTLPIPPYPLMCYQDANGAWRTRRYPEGMVRAPDPHYLQAKAIDFGAGF